MKTYQKAEHKKHTWNIPKKPSTTCLRFANPNPHLYHLGYPRRMFPGDLLEFSKRYLQWLKSPPRSTFPSSGGTLLIPRGSNISTKLGRLCWKLWRWGDVTDGGDTVTVVMAKGDLIFFCGGGCESNNCSKCMVFFSFIIFNSVLFGLVPIDS